MKTSDVIRALPVRVGDSGMLPLGQLADIETRQNGFTDFARLRATAMQR